MIRPILPASAISAGRGLKLTVSATEGAILLLAYQRSSGRRDGIRGQGSRELVIWGDKKKGGKTHLYAEECAQPRCSHEPWAQK